MRSALLCAARCISGATRNSSALASRGYRSRGKPTARSARPHPLPSPLRGRGAIGQRLAMASSVVPDLELEGTSAFRAMPDCERVLPHGRDCIEIMIATGIAIAFPNRMRAVDAAIEPDLPRLIRPLVEKSLSQSPVHSCTARATMRSLQLPAQEDLSHSRRGRPARN